jgi:hypothetical protein
MGSTIAWLVSQNYIVPGGPLTAERLTLTDKGLAALSAMPLGLGGTAGQELVKHDKGDWSSIGDLIGGIIGGGIKSLGSGS